MAKVRQQMALLCKTFVKLKGKNANNRTNKERNQGCMEDSRPVSVTSPN